MKRIIRERRLTTEEAAKYNKVRQQVERELPDLTARHHDRMASKDSPAQPGIPEILLARIADVLTGTSLHKLSHQEKTIAELLIATGYLINDDEYGVRSSRHTRDLLGH